MNSSLGACSRLDPRSLPRHPSPRRCGRVWILGIREQSLCQRIEDPIRVWRVAASSADLGNPTCRLYAPIGSRCVSCACVGEKQIRPSDGPQQADQAESGEPSAESQEQQ